MRASFTIPACAHERGTNIRVRLVGTTPWTDTEPMLHCTGQYPAWVEYDVPLPVAAEYTVAIRYAAADARPLELSIDGKLIGPCCHRTTGGWNTSQVGWETACTLALSKGVHTVRLARGAGFPHLVSLRFDGSAAFPAGWKLNRPDARELPASNPAAGQVNVAALRRAIENLIATFGSRYPDGAAYLTRLEKLEKQLREAKQADQTPARRELIALRREALIANPLLDFPSLLVIQRSVQSPRLGLPQNWQSNSSLPIHGYDDAIMRLSLADGRLSTLYKPGDGRFVGDVDLHFDADRLLFSMPDPKRRWQVWEIRADGTGLRQLTGEQPDVDSYDACYLPSGKIAFTSTACFQAVPCTGSDDVAVLYVMDADGRNIRQLCFDQDHDWCPTVLNNGRVLYTRWEYTDSVHCHNRRLFHMNPDGTEQMAYFSTNSYWPNAFFYARPIPNHPTMVAAVISGHHGSPRMGELVLFDPARGRHEG